MAGICVIAVLGTGLLCMGESGGGNTVDASTDFKTVKLPAHWRAECVDASSILRADAPEACEIIIENNRILKKRRVGARPHDK